SAFRAVARRAQQLEIFDRAGPTQGYRDYVVELQALFASARDAAPRIATPDGETHLFRDDVSLRHRRRVVLLHQGHGTLDPARLLTAPLQNQRLGLGRVEALVFPVDLAVEE